jgi:excisionase family DNA binding protein
MTSATKHHVNKFLHATKVPGWKTRQEIAKWLRVSVRTVDYWTEDGTLPALRKGRIVRYDLDVCASALKAFLPKPLMPGEDF